MLGSDFSRLLSRLTPDLESHPWALVGGLAVSARTLPRFTQDLDLAVPVRGDPEAERLLFASCGLEDRVVAGAEPLEVLPGVVVPVANRGDLIAMKLLARDDLSRPQDRLDLRNLLQIASSAELERARESAAIITTRSYSRGRDLTVALDEALLEFRPSLPDSSPG